MSNTNQKSYWTRLCERIVRKPNPETRNLKPREPMDAVENDRVLAQMSEGDQVYRTLLNYAFTHVENNLATAFDVTKSVEDRRDFNNRAAGVAAFITDVETTRARLKEEILARQRRDAARPAAGGQRK